MKIKKESGFTLAETAVVISILGVLLILGIMNYTGILESNKISEARTDAPLGADPVFSCMMAKGTLREKECKEQLKTALPGYVDVASGETYYLLVKDDPSDPNRISAVDFCRVLDKNLTVQHRYWVDTDELESRAVTPDSARGNELKNAGEVDEVCSPGEGWCISW